MASWLSNMNKTLYLLWKKHMAIHYVQQSHMTCQVPAHDATCQWKKMFHTSYKNLTFLTKKTAPNIWQNTMNNNITITGYIISMKTCQAWFQPLSAMPERIAWNGKGAKLFLQAILTKMTYIHICIWKENLFGYIISMKTCRAWAQPLSAMPERIAWNGKGAKLFPQAILTKMNYIHMHLKR